MSSRVINTRNWIVALLPSALFVCYWVYQETEHKEQPEPQELKLCYPIKESTPINERQEIYFNSLIEEK